MYICTLNFAVAELFVEVALQPGALAAWTGHTTSHWWCQWNANRGSQKGTGACALSITDGRRRSAYAATLCRTVGPPLISLPLILTRRPDSATPFAGIPDARVLPVGAVVRRAPQRVHQVVRDNERSGIWRRRPRRHDGVGATTATPLATRPPRAHPRVGRMTSSETHVRNVSESESHERFFGAKLLAAAAAAAAAAEGHERVKKAEGPRAHHPTLPGGRGAGGQSPTRPLRAGCGTAGAWGAGGRLGQHLW